MEIRRNRVVALEYTLKDDAGGVIDKSGKEPLYYLHGHSNLVVGLEEALEGKAPGDKLSVSVPPAPALPPSPASTAGAAGCPSRAPSGGTLPFASGGVPWERAEQAAASKPMARVLQPIASAPRGRRSIPPG